MNFDLNKLLFLDIETVSQYQHLSELSSKERKFWDGYYHIFKERVTDKTKLPVGYDETEELYKEEVYRQTAAFFPEFGKICCVSLAFVTKDGETRMESFYGEDEYKLLEETRKVLDKVGGMGFAMCGHNIKGFDIPFLAKRFVIKGLNPPGSFPKHDSKPWELNVVDTKDVWNFGNTRGLSSLDLVCQQLNIESPKDGDVKGDSVYHFYWDKKHELIKEYCEKDVKTLVHLIEYLMKLK